MQMYRITPKGLGAKRLRAFYMAADGAVSTGYKRCLSTTVPQWRLDRVMDVVCSQKRCENNHVVWLKDKKHAG